jgi:hypothetical protein
VNKSVLTLVGLKPQITRYDILAAVFLLSLLGAQAKTVPAALFTDAARLAAAKVDPSVG